MQRGISRAEANKAIRQAALREQLAAQKHGEHVVDCITKLEDFTIALDPLQVARLKTAIQGRLALLKKYLPDLTQQAPDQGDGLPEVILKNYTGDYDVGSSEEIEATVVEVIES